jgi:hypothetical protein
LPASVTFEAGSTLREIGESVLEWNKLKRRVIPASVEVIGKCALQHRRSLASVTFEAGSVLRAVGGPALWAVLAPTAFSFQIPLRTASETAAQTHKLNDFEVRSEKRIDVVDTTDRDEPDIDCFHIGLPSRLPLLMFRQDPLRGINHRNVAPSPFDRKKKISLAF